MFTLASRGDKVYATVRSKSGSKSGADEISSVEGDVTIVEGIDVAKDDVGDALKAALSGVTIDCLINNSGIAGGGDDMFAAQKLDKVTMDDMRQCFEVNTLGPLRVTQALMAQIPSGGKVVVISTGLGSIGDNGSGGMYAYRASKAAVNMVTKSLAADLKKDDRGVAVTAIAPGFVATCFAGSAEKMAGWGAKPVGQATEGILATIDAMTVENAGKFIVVPTDGTPPKEFGW